MRKQEYRLVIYLPVYPQACKQVLASTSNCPFWEAGTKSYIQYPASSFKADSAAFNKEIFQISEIKDLQPATIIPCCLANEAR